MGIITYGEYIMKNTIKKVIIPSAVAFGMVTTMNVSDSFADEFKAMANHQEQKIEQQVQMDNTFDKVFQAKYDKTNSSINIPYTANYDKESMKDQIGQFVDAANSGNVILYNNVLTNIDWNNLEQAYETLRKNMIEQVSAMTGIDYTRYIDKASGYEEGIEKVNYLEIVPLQHQYLLSVDMIETGEMLIQQSKDINDNELRKKVQEMGEILRTVGPAMFGVGYVMEGGKIYLGGNEKEYNQIIERLTKQEINNYNAMIGQPVIVADCYFEHMQDRKQATMEESTIAMK